MAYTVTTYPDEETLEIALIALTTEVIISIVTKGLKFTLILDE